MSSASITHSGDSSVSQEVYYARPLRCFQHICSSKNKFFTFDLPTRCLICSEPFDNNNSFIHQLTEFPIPWPFIDTRQIQVVTIIVKPNRGNFLTSYNPGDDLHIGLTDSKGLVYSYDQLGLQSESAEPDWSVCLEVFSVPVNEKQFQQLVSLINTSFWSASGEGFCGGVGYGRYIAKMAEDLEDEHLSERTRDCEDFSKSRFEVWKHNYRIASADNELTGVEIGFQQTFNQYVVCFRQLGRLKGMLVALLTNDVSSNSADFPTKSNVEELLDEINSWFNKCNADPAQLCSSKNDGEFNWQEVSAFLPAFDASDMESFLGEAVGPVHNADSDDLAYEVKDESHLKNANELLVKGGDLVHRFKLCDEFIYIE